MTETQLTPMPAVPTIGNPTFRLGQKFRAYFYDSVREWVILGLRTTELVYDPCYDGSSDWGNSRGQDTPQWEYNVYAWVTNHPTRGPNFSEYGWLTEEKIVEGMKLAD